jgi:hypothetical protein
LTRTLRPTDPQHLDQDGVVVARHLRVRIARIDAQVLGVEFQHALETVGLGHSAGHERGVQCIEHGGLEARGARLAVQGHGDEGHGGSGFEQYVRSLDAGNATRWRTAEASARRRSVCTVRNRR